MFGAARKWVYTHTVEGRFQRIHRWSGVVLIAFFLVVPWLNYQGNPVFRADLTERRLYLLGTTFTSSDTIFLVLLLIMGGFTLFAGTAILGRLWCGWACPQTVFLEEWIRPVETFLEGETAERVRRDKGPWNFDKIWRKTAKISIFAAVAIVVGFTFGSWFNDPRLLWTGRAGVGPTVFSGALAALLFADFAWFREQFCNYLCPYARFQGVLTDPQSLVIAYDKERGDPRRGGKPRDAHGACIDCKKCVVVCPAGIDIRDGFQLECISCARCVDACEGVMAKHDAPSLVRYAGLEKSHLLRPRVLVYAAILTVAVTAFGVLAARHDTVQASVNRAPGSLYIVDNDGWIRNTFLVRISNNGLDKAGSDFALSAEGLPSSAEVRAAPVHLSPAASAIVPLIVRVPATASEPTIPFTVVVRSGDDQHRELVKTTFKGAGSS